MAQKYPGITRIQRKNGVSYLVRYRDTAGKQRARTFRTLAEAKVFKGQVDQARRNGGIPSQRADKVTFAEYADTWVRSKKLSPSTIRRRNGILAKHLLPQIGHLKLSKIQHSTLQSLVDEWVDAGYSPYTVRNHVRQLAPIFQRAIRDDLLVKNPALGLDLPKIRQKHPRSLTADECVALIQSATEDYAPIIEVLISTGCRWGELANTNIADFDPKNHSLYVRQSKTDAGIRTIPLDRSDTNVITKHLLATGRLGHPGDSPLFTSPDGKRLNYANFRSRVFVPACRRAGITGVTIHSLRRTHATMLVSSGQNAKAIQTRMGHASIQTTLTHYASATEADMASTASAKARYLASVQPEPSNENEVG